MWRKLKDWATRIGIPICMAGFLLAPIIYLTLIDNRETLGRDLLLLGSVWVLLCIALVCGMLVVRSNRRELGREIWFYNTVFFVGWLMAPTITSLIFIWERRNSGLHLLIAGIIWTLLFIAFFYWFLKFILRKEKTWLEEDEIFSAATYTGETGNIHVPGHGEASLRVMSTQNKKIIRTNTTSGNLVLPADKYWTSSYEISMPGEANENWTIRTFLISKQILVVDAASSQSLNTGPPFIAYIQNKSEKERYANLILWIVDKANHSYRITNQAAKTKEVAGFQVLDASGEILWSGPFSWREAPLGVSRGTYKFSGQVPDDVRGKLTIRPVVSGPFEIETRDTHINFG